MFIPTPRHAGIRPTHHTAQHVRHRRGKEQPCSFALEGLEQRQLMSATLLNSILTITGTNNNDALTLDTSGSQVVVNDNGVVRSFSSVRQVLVDTLSGGDTVNVLRTLQNVVTSIKFSAGSTADVVNVGVNGSVQGI